MFAKCDFLSGNIYKKSVASEIRSDDLHLFNLRIFTKRKCSLRLNAVFIKSQINKFNLNIDTIVFK